MYDHTANSHSRSLGILRKAEKTKPRSPDLIGTIKIEEHTLRTLVEHYKESGGSLTANLAGWVYAGKQGKQITVELSPRYQKRATVERFDIDDFLSDSTLQ